MKKRKKKKQARKKEGCKRKKEKGRRAKMVISHDDDICRRQKFICFETWVYISDPLYNYSNHFTPSSIMQTLSIYELFLIALFLFNNDQRVIIMKGSQYSHAHHMLMLHM